MRAARYLTLCWPGLPWLWLRGSLMGLVLALAFAVAFDVAVVTTWIWSELVDLPVAVGIWAAAGAILVVSTASAVHAFPPPLPCGRDAAMDALFIAARDAYLARDWTSAEAGLRSLLVRAPTDGEAQLLLATLLRRVGRAAEAREALEKLSRADSGAPWRAEIARELARLDADASGPEEAVDPVSLPIRAEPAPAGRRDAAA
ncbi:MAG: tetratricopeptide repeat protein [Planctomycetaceae bacterium]